MKASREFKRWIATMRRKCGKKNGVITSGLLDNPKMERKRMNPRP
jgi:hypothetical protein